MFLHFLLGTAVLIISCYGYAQGTGGLEGQALYDNLKAFELQEKITVSQLKLKRDIGEMTFTGDFYFSATMNGRITGAVFIGEGMFRAGMVESDFKTAVLRFTDDTYDIIGKESSKASEIPRKARNLAKDLEPRLLEETGANISARLAVSIANNESPGFFLAQFDEGKRGRFTFMIDPQCRIPDYAFQIDGGEKVTVFSYAPYTYGNDLWIAAFTQQDFANKSMSYAGDYDVVDPKHYKMEIDVRKAGLKLRTKMRIDFISLADNLRAVPMVVNEDLTAFDNKRLKDSMRVESARYNGRDIPCIQEDWEAGLTFLLPKPMSEGEEFSLEVSMSGDAMENLSGYEDVYHLYGTTSWYPRHGFIKRSTFDLIFRHNEEDHVSSVGSLVRRSRQPDGGDWLTEYKMDTPIPLATFVTGILERHSKIRNLKYGEMEIRYYSLPTSLKFERIKEELILTELGNAMEYFTDRFGPYPYKDFQSTFCSYISRSSIGNLVILPGYEVFERYSFSYISSAIFRQWWGNLITMRSYRDQWLEEGIVEYFGLLYVLDRMQDKRELREFLDSMRYSLQRPPITDTGVAEGKVGEIGPLILGRRLQSRSSINSYNMVNDKGALVLRMLHYLFSHPSTGDDSLFFRMLKDFMDQYAHKAASAEDFINIANKHFPETIIAKRFLLKDLNWFFGQWLYEARLPGYRMEYHLEPGEDGRVVIAGKIIQENAPDHWFMPLPVIIKYPGDEEIRVMVWADGPETDIQIPSLPMEPKSIELDPDWWILSEKTETKKD